MMTGMRKTGHKPEAGMDIPMKGGSEKMIYPTVHFSFKDFPEVKKWKVGETYYVALEIKQTSMDMHENRGGEEYGGAGFDIRGVKVLNNPGHEKKMAARYK